AALGAFAEASALPFAPAYSGAREAIRASRTIDGRPVDLHAFYYARQHESQEMIHASNALVRNDDGRWPIRSRGAQSTPFGTVQAYRVGNGAGESLLVWHWYAVGGTQTASAYRAKAATAWSLATGRGDHSLAVALATPVGDGSAEAVRAAEQRLAKAAASIAPAVDAGSRGRVGPGQRR
ncbi:MAG: EpsI family protein, partial [Burkholderiales bacterium]